MPLREEAAERRGLHRLDLLAQPGQRAPLELAQHLGVAPLARAPAGRDLALHHAARGGEALERGAHRGDAEAEARGDVVQHEGAVGARVARDEVAERVGHGLEQRRGQPAGELDAERVAEAGGVLGGGEAALAGDRAARSRRRGARR